MKAGRNDPCPCGSGKKFKRCCTVETIRSHWVRNTLLALLLLAGVTLVAAALFERTRDYDPQAQGGRWCPTHQTWHEASADSDAQTTGGRWCPTHQTWHEVPAE